MLEIATVLLSGIMSMAVGGIIGNRSDTALDNLLKKTKEMLQKDENKYLNHDIEKSVTSGYYFALYYCASESKAKAKKSINKGLLSKIQEIEGIIDEKQKSDNKDIWGLFCDTSEVALLIDNRMKEAATKTIIKKLLAATFDGYILPVEFLNEAEMHLFDKMKSYFIEEVKTNERVKNFLDTRMLAEIKGSIENHLPQISDKLDELLKPRYGGIDRSYDLKLELIKKFNSWFGQSPLKEATTVKVDEMPSEIVNLYRSWLKRNDDSQDGSTDNNSGSSPDYYTKENAGNEEDDMGVLPLSLLDKLVHDKESEDFQIVDDEGTQRMFFIIRSNDTPYYVYLALVEPTSIEIKDGKVHRTYSIQNSYKLSGAFQIVTVVLEEDHALIQTVRTSKGKRLDRFYDNRILDYVSENKTGAEFENDDSEKEVFYGIDNPECVFTFIEAQEQRVIKPKVKYDYELGIPYGCISVKSNVCYLVLRVNFSDIEISTDAYRFYEALKEEANIQSLGRDEIRQFGQIIKSRLIKLHDLYLGDDDKGSGSDILQYLSEMFRWTAVSADYDTVENEMDQFIALINPIMKQQTDKYDLLGMSELQARALYNKGIANKHVGNYERAAALFEKGAKIIRTILKVQADYPLRQSLSSYENSLASVNERK